MGSTFSHRVPKDKLFITFRAILSFYELTLVPIGPKGTAEVATYTSITEWHGKRTLWYPDRKYFLLGKYITDKMLE